MPTPYSSCRGLGGPWGPLGPCGPCWGPSAPVRLQYPNFKLWKIGNLCNFDCNFVLSLGKIWLWPFYIFLAYGSKILHKKFQVISSKNKAVTLIFWFKIKSKFEKITVMPSFLPEWLEVFCVEFWNPKAKKIWNNYSHILPLNSAKSWSKSREYSIFTQGCLIQIFTTRGLRCHLQIISSCRELQYSCLDTLSIKICPLFQNLLHS